MNPGEFQNYLFVVGAQKAGTSALHSYLSSHPMIVAGDYKELHFFDRKSSYEKGSKYYRSLFPYWTKGMLALDTTPAYMHHRETAKRIHSFRADAKIIMLLREPVSRAYSAFNMYRHIYKKAWFRKRVRHADRFTREFFLPLVEGNQNLDVRYFLDREMDIISEETDVDEPSLIRRGLYARQMGRFTDLFGRDNILVLFSDELRDSANSTVERVFKFTNLRPGPTKKYPPKNVLAYTAENSDRALIRTYAQDLFDKDKHELKMLHHLDVPW